MRRAGSLGGLAAIDRKLVRDLARVWPQALAIALVLASGVATLILAIGAYRSLEETRRLYYARNGFADVFAEVKRAPKALADRIRVLPGVSLAEMRIERSALLDVAGMREPATGIALSVPDHGEPALNRPHVRLGRLPVTGATDEVAVNEPFAKAHGMGIGSRLGAILNGRKRELTVVGIVLSPEYIYAIGPGDLMPDYRRFAVMWMSEKALAGIFDLEGAFNSVSLKLEPDANESEVIRRLDLELARYGGMGAYGRADQVSHAFLDAELKQLAALARVIPPVFLLVSAFLINMTLMRMIALEREQIGLLKALGYANASIAAHYLKFIGLIAALGILIGFGLGTWFGTSLTRLYGNFFQFPFLVFERDGDLYAIAATVSLAAATLGAARAITQALALAPAVAMQPPAPPSYRRLPGESRGLYARASQMTVMALRNMARWPARAALTCIGLSLSVALLVLSLFTFDSVEAMIDATFTRSQRQDASIDFPETKPARVVEAAAHLPGILRVEPYRSVAARLRNGHLSRRVSLIGRPPRTLLSRDLDTDLMPVALPEQGVLLNRRLASVLSLNRGDTVEIEILDGRRGTRQVPVAGVIESYIGLVVLMRLDALNAMLDEGAVVSGLHLAYDRAEEDRLFTQVKRTPQIASLALKRLSLERFRATLAENINLMVSVYVVLSVVVSLGILYNSARIQLSERARDLASLRVLGFHKGEVARVLMTELALLTALAQPLGWLIGYGLGWLTIQSFSSDLYTAPFVIERATFAKASAVTLASGVISALIVRRRIDSLDLIAVLKTRE
ncbi:MAG: ABC transporter permease [Hyphomicrobiaceae bacterium]|nr:ABC transporter permease [Hyphomicrobiaceae bacterium]